MENANGNRTQKKSRNMGDLRNHLFDALDRLKTTDEKGLDGEVERAEAVAHVAAQIIQSAKVELQFLNTVSSDKLPKVADAIKAGEFFERPQLSAKGLATGKDLGTK